MRKSAMFPQQSNEAVRALDVISVRTARSRTAIRSCAGAVQNVCRWCVDDMEIFLHAVFNQGAGDDAIDRAADGVLITITDAAVASPSGIWAV